MDNKFIPQAIEIVKQAIEADNAKVCRVASQVLCVGDGNLPADKVLQ